MGLPQCTPIPVLPRQAGFSSVTARLEILIRIFLIHLLASPPNLHLSELAHSLLPPRIHYESRGLLLGISKLISAIPLIIFSASYVYAAEQPTF